ncbi:MAG: MupA/Atu3671 family FMN-dependent luciferase-like monooxygenase [Hyphomicrobiaceae bacterium]
MVNIDAVVKDVELSSLQQGMVFHQLSHGQYTGVDITQIICEIDHAIDKKYLEDSWRIFSQSCDQLRSCINLDASPPRQVITNQPVPDIHYEDWSNCSDATELPSRLRDYLRSDREAGFDISTAPLYRIALIDLGNDQYRLIWSFHHLIYDGGSWALALIDLFDIYDALVAGKSLPDLERPDRSNWLDWMSSHNWKSSMPYWRDLLAGLDTSTSLKPAISGSNGNDAEFAKDEVELTLSEEDQVQITAWAAENKVSVNALVQAAWAILHARYTDNPDVVIGAIRGGRAGTVADVGQMFGTFITNVPTRIHCGDLSALEIVMNTRAQHVDARPHEHTPLAEIQGLVKLPPGHPLFESLVVYDRKALHDFIRDARPEWTSRTFRLLQCDPFPFTLYVHEQPTLHFLLAFQRGRMSADQARASLDHLVTLLRGIMASPSTSWRQLPLLTDNEHHILTVGLNETGKTVPETSIQQQFERTVADDPALTSIISGDTEVSYDALNRRANSIAARLRREGVGPGHIVGVSLDRSINMVASILGVLKAGAAYLPLDPDYPLQRIDFCLRDSGAQMLITNSELAPQFRAAGTALLLVDDDQADDGTDDFQSPHLSPEALAYSIYTSGSTGLPKGVLVEHGNVINFFEGMDDVVADTPRKRWLAVTSLSFDISVLELLWTLTRGYTVVLAGGASDGKDENAAQRKIGFSLFYFASDPGGVGREKYDLVLKGAEFADKHGFEAIWTPERHFHAFGGLYPNPSVIGAAVAAITQNIGIRSGSIVLPLHHPLRVVEEWSLVDNLCNGKVGLSVASGWQPNDFVLAPDRYEGRRESLYDDVETVRKLWRGDAVQFENPKGDLVDIQTLPRPVQPEVPIWITASGSPDTFRKAGEIGANLLTHLLGQTMAEVAEKIAIYRQARRDAGYTDHGQVTMMLHTLVGSDNAAVREAAREPMKNYLRSAASLVAQYADAWSAYKRSEGKQVTDSKAFDDLGPEEMEGLLDFAFERYYETSALFGTPEKCTALVEEAHNAGVDEIACLIDFGVDQKIVLDSLKHLNSLKTQARRRIDASEVNLSDLVLKHDVSHMQCTPSGARTMLGEEQSTQAIGKLDQMLVGGEAFPTELWTKLRAANARHVVNMYGPTETTIWSSYSKLDPNRDDVSIGTPIANTSCYVLDTARQLVPFGVAGELHIGGAGVARGYHDRDTLSAERFIDNPFSSGTKMYATGDIVRWTANGELEFLGRVDHQVKIRGFRVELGEIESKLSSYDAVEQAVVVAIGNADGAQELVAYCKPAVGGDFAPQSVAAYLGDLLPEYMVPSQILVIDDFPLTPNKKVDRSRLPDPAEIFRQRSTNEAKAPKNEVETMIKNVWESVLGLSNISTRDNFFEIGGHSLRAVQVQSQLRESLKQQFPITDLFRFPTIEDLAQHLSSGTDRATSDEAIARGQRRRSVQRRRRKEVSMMN